jgi:hypothetical protein
MLTLVVPGLIWPRQALADLSFDLPLPAFSLLLGRGRLSASAAADADGLLAAELGADTPVPAAALRRLSFGRSRDDADWLCLDPVRLRFEERSMVLDDPAQLDLDGAEAEALAVSLAPTFAPLGELEATGTAMLEPAPAVPGTQLCRTAARHRPYRRAAAGPCRLPTLAPGAQRSADGAPCPPRESGTRSRRTPGGEFTVALGRRPADVRRPKPP